MITVTRPPQAQTPTPRPWLSVCLMLLAFLLTPSILASDRSGDALSATVDRTQLALNETLELTVEWRGAAQGQPDFSPLRHQFQVLGSHQSSQTSMVGTDIDTVTRWHLTLLPQQAGTLIIPSLHFGAGISEAIEIQVTEARQSERAERHFWLESSVDREQAHLDEQILLTYRLYYATPLRQMTRDDLTIEGADLQPLRERQFQAVIDGTGYQVAELRFAVFPSRPGHLEIPPLRLNGYTSEGAHSRLGGLIRGLGNPVNLTSDAHTIEILPRPAGSPDGSWLPAQSLTLSEQWSHNDQPIRVGEPITRTVRIDAEGVKAQQLPEIHFGEHTAYRIYPDQPRLQQREEQNGLLASRTESHALIATQAGTLTLPDVRIAWWDTGARRWREAVLEGKNIEVLAAPVDASTVNHDLGGGDEIVSPPTSRPWPPILWLSFALNALLVAILIYLWRRERGTPAPADQAAITERALLKKLEACARQGDALTFRRALLDWGQKRWSEQPPLTLSQLSARVEGEDLSRRLTALDGALYDDRGKPATSELLWAILTDIKGIDRGNTAPGARSESLLPPLYPR